MEITIVNGKDINFIRKIRAPRALVYEAWAKEEALASWFGPEGFAVASNEFNFEEGGHWAFTMTGQDGTVYPNVMEFKQLVKPERIAYRMTDGTEDCPNAFDVVVTLEEEREFTLLTIRTIFASAEIVQESLKFGALEAGVSTFSKLQTAVETSYETNQLKLERKYNAPIGLVFDCLTKAEHLIHWWGPIGFKVEVPRLDLEPNGLFLYKMINANFELWGRFKYLQIEAPSFLSYVVSFSDENAGITRHPAPEAATWPLEQLVNLQLIENEGITTITMESIPINASNVEIETFEKGKGGMRQGFKGTFDQLESYLAQLV
jgi:uncharacterized protein YndB with AHSA1/START domain